MWKARIVSKVLFYVLTKWEVKTQPAEASALIQRCANSVSHNVKTKKRAAVEILGVSELLQDLLPCNSWGSEAMTAGVSPQEALCFEAKLCDQDHSFVDPMCQAQGTASEWDSPGGPKWVLLTAHAKTCKGETKNSTEEMLSSESLLGQGFLEEASFLDICASMKENKYSNLAIATQRGNRNLLRL